MKTSLEPFRNLYFGLCVGWGCQDKVTCPYLTQLLIKKSRTFDNSGSLMSRGWYGYLSFESCRLHEGSKKAELTQASLDCGRKNACQLDG